VAEPSETSLPPRKDIETTRQQLPPEKAAEETQRLAPVNRRPLYWTLAAGFPAFVVAAFIFLPAPGVNSPPVFSVCGVVAAVVLCCATYTDLRWRKIPNYFTYPAVVWGLGLHATAAMAGMWSGDAATAFGRMVGPANLVSSIAGFVVLFLLIVAVFSLTGGGAGDVKLVAAVGALLGLWQGIDVVATGFVFAAVLALVFAIFRFGPVFIVRSVGRMAGAVLLPMWIKPPGEDEKRLLKLPIPLAPSIALGGFVVLFGVPYDEWIRNVFT